MYEARTTCGSGCGYVFGRRVQALEACRCRVDFRRESRRLELIKGKENRYASISDTVSAAILQLHRLHTSLHRRAITPAVGLRMRSWRRDLSALGAALLA